jgi:hypothetical protein
MTVMTLVGMAIIGLLIRQPHGEGGRDNLSNSS